MDTPAVQAMATGWVAAVGELSVSVPPAGLGLPCQPSAAAVDAAHIDIAAFTASLTARVGTHATHLGETNTAYLANEGESAHQLAGVAPRIIGV